MGREEGARRAEGHQEGEHALVGVGHGVTADHETVGGVARRPEHRYSGGMSVVVGGPAVGAVAGPPELDVDAEVAADGGHGVADGAEAVVGPGLDGVDGRVGRGGCDERAR